MNKEEILERNKKLLRNGDERELVISGKANIIAKSAFTVTIMLLISFNISKGLSTDELFGVFFVYGASESLYKYYCLKEKKNINYSNTINICCCLFLGCFFS